MATPVVGTHLKQLPQWVFFHGVDVNAVSMLSMETPQAQESCKSLGYGTGLLERESRHLFQPSPGRLERLLTSFDSFPSM